MLLCLTWLALSLHERHWDGGRTLSMKGIQAMPALVKCGTLSTLKSRATGCKWGSDHRCLLGAFGAQNWSWYQAKNWPLKAFSIRGERGKSKGPFSSWVSFPVPVSHSPLDGSLRGHFLHRGSDLSFERLRSLSQMLRGAYDWEAVCKGPWHPGGKGCWFERPKEAWKVREGCPSGIPWKEWPLFCLRAHQPYY